MTEAEYHRMTEADWEAWWWARFREAAAWDLHFVRVEVLDQSFPGARLHTKGGPVTLSHKSDHLMRIYWPRRSVGRLWVDWFPEGLTYLVNPPGCYSLRLEPTTDWIEAVESLGELLEWVRFETRRRRKTWATGRPPAGVTRRKITLSALT